MNTSTFFDHFYNNAKENSVLVLNTDGTFIKANDAFKTAFKYTDQDLANKHFRILFIDKDKASEKPEREIMKVKLEGSASDDNYLLHKDGTPIWVTGESVLVRAEGGDEFILKVIHNIHAQKLLQSILMESNEFITSIFDSVNDIGLIILNSSLKVVKVNNAFSAIFGLAELPAEGNRISDINHSFWKSAEIKQQISDVLVRNISLKDKMVKLSDKTISFSVKIIDGNEGEGKNILMIVKTITEEKSEQ